MIAPTLRSGKTRAIRKNLKDYAEYVTVWTERWAPKTMLRCVDLDLCERIRKYDLNVKDGAELDEQAFRTQLSAGKGGWRAERSPTRRHPTRAAL